MSNFRDFFRSDIKRYGKGNVNLWVRCFLYFFRKMQTANNKLLFYYYKLMFGIVSRKHGVEIFSKAQIGKGLYIGHPYNITINGEAKLGNNINIHKGVTIGQENRGKRKGVPTIGNQVWFGVNSTVVGNITIGDDVLIAPNTYVNCDVPSHSIVMGCPCKIISRENATESYINNMID